MKRKALVVAFIASLAILIPAITAHADTQNTYCSWPNTRFCSLQTTTVQGYYPSQYNTLYGEAYDYGGTHYLAYDIIVRQSDGAYMAASYQYNSNSSGYASFGFYGDPNNCRQYYNAVIWYDLDSNGNLYVDHSDAYGFPNSC